MNDLIPAVESKYSTWAASTDASGLAASRDHRAFGGFSMGSVNTWRAFEHCLDYFRYFAPSSGGPIGNGAYMADIVNRSGHPPPRLFHLYCLRYGRFRLLRLQERRTGDGADGCVLPLADSEREGNLSFREREGYAHDGNAANEYMYNALRFFFSTAGQLN